MGHKIIVEIRHGLVDDVYGLPDGWEYDVVNWDDVELESEDQYHRTPKEMQAAIDGAKAPNVDGLDWDLLKEQLLTLDHLLDERKHAVASVSFCPPGTLGVDNAIVVGEALSGIRNLLEHIEMQIALDGFVILDRSRDS